MSTPGIFTSAEHSYVLGALDALGITGQVTIDSFEGEYDALCLPHGFSIQKTMGEQRGLVTVMVPQYVVSETVTYPASRYEPEGGDYREFITVGTIGEAVKAVALREKEWDIDNALESYSLSLQMAEAKEEV